MVEKIIKERLDGIEQRYGVRIYTLARAVRGRGISPQRTAFDELFCKVALTWAK